MDVFCRAERVRRRCLLLPPQRLDGLLQFAEDDLGRVIGKGGRVANAIRTIAKAAAVRLDRRVIVDILD